MVDLTLTDEQYEELSRQRLHVLLAGGFRAALLMREALKRQPNEKSIDTAAAMFVVAMAEFDEYVEALMNLHEEMTAAGELDAVSALGRDHIKAAVDKLTKDALGRDRG
jgi:hypothetical protein